MDQAKSKTDKSEARQQVYDFVLQTLIIAVLTDEKITERVASLVKDESTNPELIKLIDLLCKEVGISDPTTLTSLIVRPFKKS